MQGRDSIETNSEGCKIPGKFLEIPFLLSRHRPAPGNLWKNTSEFLGSQGENYDVKRLMITFDFYHIIRLGPSRNEF